MPRTAARVVLLCVLLADLVGAATLQKYLLTRTKPPACTDALATPPVAANSFLTTDPQFYLWFYITDLKTGDTVESMYYDPSGTFYPDASGPWDPMDHDSAGTCFTDVAFKIAGATPAAKPGKWTVRVRLNSVQIFSIDYTISAPGSTQPPPVTGGLNLTVNQVINSNCPEMRLIASVTDSAGKPVTGLSDSNFTLKEDGVARTFRVVNSSTGGSGTALSVALVIDRSGSVSGTPLSDEKAAAKALVSQLGPNDAVAVFAFDSTVTKVRDFTTDRAAINAGIDSIQSGGNTALYAAVVQASQAIASRSGRKAIVAMTDGYNNESPTEQDAINQAKLAGAPVFTVGFGSPDHAALERLAKGTGGTYHRSAASADLQNILQSIGQAISSQYEIIYTTSNASADHSVELTAAMGSSSSTAVTQAVSRCSSTAAGVNLKLEGATGRAGGSVDVPLTLNASGTPPSTWQVDVTYDASKLTFKSARKGEQCTAANKDVITSPLAANQIRVVAAAVNQNPIGNGPVAYLNFALAGTFSGSTTLTCSSPGSADSTSRSLATTCTAGTVTSAASCGCDVNGDGNTNVGDVQLIVNQVLGVVSASCDVNGDGAVNVADVQQVVNAVLGMGCK